MATEGKTLSNSPLSTLSLPLLFKSSSFPCRIFRDDSDCAAFGERLLSARHCERHSRSSLLTIQVCLHFTKEQLVESFSITHGFYFSASPLIFYVFFVLFASYQYFDSFSFCRFYSQFLEYSLYTRPNTNTS